MAERRAKGVCLLCGEGGHWIRACKLYEERVGKAATAAPPSKVCCLRHGTEEHSTAKCTLKSPPINFPSEATKADFANLCLWCGIKGHNVDDCIQLLRATRPVDRFIVPLEFADSEISACMRERAWWFILRKYAINVPNWAACFPASRPQHR